MDLKTLYEMKRQMVVRGNWKEVHRINRMIEIRLRDKSRKGRKSEVEGMLNDIASKMSKVWKDKEVHSKKKESNRKHSDVSLLLPQVQDLQEREW